jgi:hypothetical protein
MIMIYRECLPEVKTLFLQTIVKPEHHSESLSFPASTSIMIVEVQWACSLLIQILGLDNDKVCGRGHVRVPVDFLPV